MRRIITIVIVVLSATSAFVSPLSAAETPEANEYADQLDAARGTGTDQHVGDPMSRTGFDGGRVMWFRWGL